MKTLTLKDIRRFKPCYDPVQHWPENWSGTALDILKTEHCPAKDRIWVVTRKGFLSDKVLRLFAVDCPKRALSKVKNPDPRSLKVLEVAERFAHGKTTIEELRKAYIAAYAADAAAVNAADAADAAAAYIAVNAAYIAVNAADAAARKAEREQQVKVLIELIEKYE